MAAVRIDSLQELLLAADAESSMTRWIKPLSFVAAVVFVLWAMVAGPVAAGGNDDAVEAEVAARQALEFHPWFQSASDLERRRSALHANVGVQEASASSASAVVLEAKAALLAAEEVEAEAEAHVRETRGLLQAMAINTFLLVDVGSNPSPDSELDISRRAAPLEAVTSDFVADLGHAEARFFAANTVSGEAEHALTTALDRQASQQLAVDRANSYLEDFSALVAELRTEFDDRTEEVLSRNAQPELALVGQFRVNVSLVEPLTALLEAAAEDGIEFGGWGHRSVEQQIVLREAHCGASGFAVFDARASSCRPPTARPGYSQHELGLAIDFTENGAILTSSSPGFDWLKERAAEFGLINLPSEPWHWSTTGH